MSIRLIRLAPLVGEPGGSPAADVVTISRAELDALRLQAAGPPEEPRPSRSREAEERTEALAAELAGMEKKASAWEQAFKGAMRDREVATALAGRPLVSGAVGQLLKLWRDDFEVFEREGRHEVVSRDGRPASDVVAERLKSSEYAHFALPSSRGGVGGRDVASPVPGAAARGTSPRTLGEAVVSQWRSMDRPDSGATGPVGLGRPRRS
ncbi:hypothetical protein EP7_005242 [Isosphaeraceae bacterium EP7]